MYTKSKKTVWIFHFENDILREGIEDKEYDALYKSIEEIKNEYGAKNISMRCPKSSGNKKLELIFSQEPQLLSA